MCAEPRLETVFKMKVNMGVMERAGNSWPLELKTSSRNSSRGMWMRDTFQSCSQKDLRSEALVGINTGYVQAFLSFYHKFFYLRAYTQPYTSTAWTLPPHIPLSRHGVVFCEKQPIIAIVTTGWPPLNDQNANWCWHRWWYSLLTQACDLEKCL